MTLRTALGGRYLSAEEAGGGAVSADRDAAAEWERWDLLDLDGGDLEHGDLVVLRAWDGVHFLRADGAGGGAVDAAAPGDPHRDRRPLEWETWRIQRVGDAGDGAVDDGDEVALLAWDRTHLLRAVDGGGAGVDARATEVSGWEAFRISLEAPRTRWLAPGTSQALAEGTPDGALVVDPTDRHQAVGGFGSAVTESSAWLLEQLPAAARAAALDALFDPEAGAGLSATRVSMGSSDMQPAPPFWTYDDVPEGQEDPELTAFSVAPDEAHVLPVLGAALARNPALTVVASPWSAPAWMKTPAGLSGGRLRDEAPVRDAWGRYFVAFVQAYAGRGVPVAYVTPQNEPLHASPFYPTMGSDPAAEALFVGHHLGPALAAAGLDTRVLVYDHNWSEGDFADAAYPSAVLDDPDAAAHAAGAAFHCYGGSWDAQDTLHARHPEAEVWLTECSAGPWEGGTPFAEKMKLLVATTRRHARGVVLWNLAMALTGGPAAAPTCGDCQGVVSVVAETGEWLPGAQLRALEHFTRFVRPGAVRLGSSGGPEGLGHVAFENPDGSTVLVALNDTDAPAAFPVAWAGGTFSAAVAARGAVTLRW